MGSINIFMILLVLIPSVIPRVPGDPNSDSFASDSELLSTPEIELSRPYKDSSRDVNLGLPKYKGPPLSVTDSLTFEKSSSQFSLEPTNTLTSENYASLNSSSLVGLPKIPLSLEFASIPKTSVTESAKGSNSKVSEVCPKVGGSQVAGTVVKCYCQGNEILIDGKCQPFDGTAVIPFQKDWIYTSEESITNYNVTVRDVDCDPSKYLSINFTKTQFQLRPRGDVVLLQSAGDLEGQRINKYCLIHHLNSQGDQTWTMKACVPIPSVPRCCPYGLAMKDGSCQPARTPNVLRPPIAAKPFSNSVDWPIVSNYMSPLKCDSEPMITIPLNYKQSNLVSLADGLANGWVPGEIDDRRIYYQCPEYCVDGIENDDGSTDYFTSFCYSNPIEAHENSCANGLCIRKCCKKGHSLDVNRHVCVPDSNKTFNPPVEVGLTNFAIITGLPLCMPIIQAEGNISISMAGSLKAEGRIIQSTDYCIDTFLDNDDREQSALLCLDGTTPTWSKVRPTLLAICMIISLIFLITTISYHLWDRKLLGKEGIHLLFYAISLCIAYFANVAVQLFFDFFSDATCFNTAIAMQFGFLAAHFWLNINCIEIWREIRGLQEKNDSRLYCNSFYTFYGVGIPFCISMITIAMQNVSLHREWDVIKPYIGISSCWFNGDISLLIYFYGPIAFTCLFNILLLVFTHIKYWGVVRNVKDSSKIEQTVERQAVSENGKKFSGNVNNDVRSFSTRLNLLTFVVLCWCTEIISWKVPPNELWALTDTLNSLQGVFTFLFLLALRDHNTPADDGSRGFLRICKKYLGKLIRTSRQTNSSDFTGNESNSTA